MEKFDAVIARVLADARRERKRTQDAGSVCALGQGEEITMTTHGAGRGQWKTVHHGKGAVSKNTPGGGYMETARADGERGVARKLK